MRNRFYSNVTTLLVTILMLAGCGAAQHLPTQSSQVTTTIIRDSVAIHTDTVKVEIPVERYVDVVPAYDTLRLETTLAKSEAFVDTLTHTLKGKLEHKPGALTTDVKYVERVRVEYRDSLVTKEIPVEVEVVREVTPRWCWYLVLMNVLTVIALFIISYLKFKGKFKL